MCHERQETVRASQADGLQGGSDDEQAGSALMKHILLLLLKAVPIVGALCCALSSLTAYFGYELAWLGYVMRAVFMIAWIALAYYFRFCSFYFFLIYYIITCDTINIIDYLRPLPLTDWGCFVLHCAVIGLFVILFTYFHVRDTKKVKQHLEEMRGRS